MKSMHLNDLALPLSASIVEKKCGGREGKQTPSPPPPKHFSKDYRSNAYVILNAKYNGWVRVSYIEQLCMTYFD